MNRTKSKFISIKTLQMINLFMLLFVSLAGSATAKEYTKLTFKEHQDPEKHYKKECEAGDRYGCVKIAKIYLEKGRRDYYVYAEKACRMKNAEGCGIEGTWFFNNGSKLRGAELWDIACKTGFTDYCVAIAAYRKDDKLDFEGFLDYMHIACVASKARLDTCAYMGNYYIETLKDLERGKKYLARACDNEYQKACDHIKKLEKPNLPKKK